MAHAASETPDRLQIANLDTADSIQVQYNPEELEEAYAATYARQTVPGLSHKVMQFVNTENVVLTFDLKFDVLSRPDDYKFADAEHAKRFLQALHFPRAGTAMRDVAPSRALFLWTESFLLTTVITSCKFKHTRRFRDGKVSAFTASVTLEEIRDVRLTADDVMRYGTVRG